MCKFNLPRKRKKKYQKEFGTSFILFWNTKYRKNYWEWLYHNSRVKVRNMKVILNYPRISTNEELSIWYNEHYPKDKLTQMYIKQLK